MPRAEVGTPKYLANAMKSKGLQRLRWYCQVCEKQCRDENGFKCHMATESHLRQMLVVGESAGKHISDYSSTFQSEFVALLSRRSGTKRVKANTVYQEYIQDKHHIHMNSTKWVTLTEFLKHLGRSGIARVDETEKGWFIAWIDNSPKALAKAELSAKKEKLQMSDEQRERELLKAQIEKAQQEAESLNQDAAGPSNSNFTAEEGLQRGENEKVVLAFGKKPSPPADSPPATNEEVATSTSTAPTADVNDPSSTTPPQATASSSTSPPVEQAAPSLPKPPVKFNALKPAGNPLKGNVFKSGSKGGSSTSGTKRNASTMSAAERLMFEEMERKKRKVM
ncbi:hypothetical protein FRB94_011956 [Tulasnella sp. JGI-2019a]|nr:hypothetical protein FRB93_012720 [Tulasnella sp. JGI-2019a]KAG9009539.1 hypothetical protein FRB94_011956 [Tulasnella sp. JGI-2019a]KAG9034547.1 hypothetical protein FRB95_013114 [Tulasnella sp. JGI-2019a]